MIDAERRSYIASEKPRERGLRCFLVTSLPAVNGGPVSDVKGGEPPSSKRRRSHNPIVVAKRTLREFVVSEPEYRWTSQQWHPNIWY